jgi:outer membrane receptor protein involved in Fe transport
MLTLLVGLAAADEPTTAPVNPFREADESALFRFDEQLVTVASRYAQTVRKAPSIVTLITADDIRHNGYRTVADALRTIPGVYMWTSVEGRDLAAIRGVISPDNNKLLVLVDGVPFYDGLYTNSFVGDALPISAVKQIEVIKGPGSAIYGTNAFTGVVNLVTWQGRDLEGARVRLLAGTGKRFDLTASGGGTERVGGIDVAASVYARVHSVEGWGIDLIPRGRRNIEGFDPREGMNVGGQVKIGGLRLQVHHLDYSHRFRQATEFDDPYEAIGNDIDSFGLYYSKTFFDGRYDFTAGPLTLTPFFMGQRHDDPGAFFFTRGFDTTEVEPGVFETRQLFSVVETEKDTARWSTGLDAEIRPGIDHRVVAGAGLENTTVLSVVDTRYDDGAHYPVLHDGFAVYNSCGVPTGFDDLRMSLPEYPDERCKAPALRTLYAYAQYSWTVLPSLELTAGARLDNRLAPVNSSPPAGLGLGGDLADSTFFSVSPRAGILLVPSETVTAKILYGRAFRAPTVRELLVVAEYDEDDGEYPSTTANFQLRPETINTLEGEFAVETESGFKARVDGSWSVLNSEIDKVAPGLYCNLPGQLQIIGAEADFSARFGPFEGDIGYALTLATYGGNDAANNCQDGDRNDFANGDNPYQGLRQYEFPPHMVKGRLAARVTENVRLTGLGEFYGPRPRAEWFDPGVEVDRVQEDGPPVLLLHATASAIDIGRKDRFGVNISVRNLLDTRFSTAEFRDDVNVLDTDFRGQLGPRFDTGYVGEGRTVTAAVEFKL